MIRVLDVFPQLSNELFSLLESLSYEEWEKETCLKGRTVKDLASHLVDTSLRRLALQRDGYFTESPQIASYDDLVSFIQKMNNDWIIATQRLSPRILITLLRNSELELVEFLNTLNLQDKAIFPIDWAGEKESENWFDIAREYTEKWHHQMQIREALGNSEILYQPHFFQPIIDCFIKAIPFTYEKLDKSNFNLEIEIIGQCGYTLYLQKSDEKVSFLQNVQTENKIGITQEEFWKLVTNSKPKNEIAFTARGDETVTSHFLNVVAVMS